MNFRGHFAGGLAAGAAAGSFALIAVELEIGGSGAGDVLGGEPGGVTHFAGVFAAAWFMALFPDLDTASIPQRWFLRAAFLLLLAALIAQRLDLFVLLAFASLLPLIHRHRGWTHWKATPWLIALFLAIVHEFLRSQASWFSGFSWSRVWQLLQDYWPYALASVLGHYTHLLLDSRRLRWLPFIRNPEGHH